MNLPAEYLNRMQKRLGEGFPAFLRAMEQPPLRGVRANTLKLSPAAFAAIFPHAGDPVPWEKAGFYTDAERLGAFPAHHAGLFYVQEPSAMCAAPLLDARPDERVLDLCAAPGGKTTQLAAAMGGGGVLIANEYVYDRARILSQNVERLGVKNCAVVSADPAALARVIGERVEEYGEVPRAEMTAVGGTATSLAALARGIQPYDPAKVHGTFLTAEEIGEWGGRLLGVTQSERLALKGMDPARADILGGGALLLGGILRKIGARGVRVSERDNMEGYLLLSEEER